MGLEWLYGENDGNECRSNFTGALDWLYGEDCDGDCSRINLVGCRTLSHAECDRELSRRDFGYALVVAQEKVRDYLSEAMQIYGPRNRIVVG